MKNKKNCENCNFSIEDNNIENIWNECRNPKSEYYFDNINNIEKKICDKWKKKEIKCQKK